MSCGVRDDGTPVVSGGARFLGPAHLQRGRGNSLRTCNARLAAIHSLFGYAALQHPEHAQLIAPELSVFGYTRDHRVITLLVWSAARTQFRRA
jgi:hypothetical protein